MARLRPRRDRRHAGARTSSTGRVRARGAAGGGHLRARRPRRRPRSCAASRCCPSRCSRRAPPRDAAVRGRARTSRRPTSCGAPRPARSDKRAMELFTVHMMGTAAMGADPARHVVRPVRPGARRRRPVRRRRQPVPVADRREPDGDDHGARHAERRAVPRDAIALRPGRSGRARTSCPSASRRGTRAPSRRGRSRRGRRRASPP